MPANAPLQPNVNVYTQGFASSPLNVQTPHLDVRNPAPTDVNYPIGKRWVNTVGNSTFTLTSYSTVGGITSADWQSEGGGTVGLNTLTGNSGGPVPPTADNINLLGANTTTVVGVPGTSTLTITPTSSGYPITPFVVGIAGQAGYQTIQSAINAAVSSGSAAVYIQNGIYTENLTLASGVNLIGNAPYVTIIGNHTLPLSGSVSVENIFFQCTGNVLAQVSASSATVSVNNCFFTITSGYIINVTAGTGNYYINNCIDIGSTNNGVFFSAVSSGNLYITNSTIGQGSVNHLNCATTFMAIYACEIACPINVQSGGVLVYASILANQFTIMGTASVTMSHCSIFSGASPAILMSSSQSQEIMHTSLNSSNNPCIDGVGAGGITLDTISYRQSRTVNGALTINTFVSNLQAGTGITLTSTAGNYVVAATGTLAYKQAYVIGDFTAGVLQIPQATHGLPASQYYIWTIYDTTAGLQAMFEYNVDVGGNITFTNPAGVGINCKIIIIS